MELKEYEQKDYRCLCLQVPRDAEVDAYEEDEGGRTFADSWTQVGCVWSSFRMGERLAVFGATAATTRMSLMFQRSAAMRGIWQAMGRASGALAVLLDCEDEGLLLLHPFDRAVMPPELVDGELADELGLDAYWERCLELAGL